MKNILSFVLFFIFLFFNISAYAETAVTPDITILNTVTQAMSAVASKTILPQAMMWFGSLMGLQFIISNLGMLKNNADIGDILYKLIGSLIWFGFCVILLQEGPDFIDSVGSGILNKFASNLPTPGSIITATLALCASLFIGIAATGTSIAGIGNSSVAMVLVYALFIVFGIGMFLAIKIFMLQLELGLIVMLAPLSFSLLGLNALKDQGIAPLKSLISLVYRMVIFGVIFGAFSEIVSVTGAQLDSVSWANPLDWGKKANAILSMLCAFPILGYLTFKSDSIASSLASGQTNMGTGDVASAAAIGAAAGAAVASGGAAAVSSGSKAVESMSSFMKSGEVSNASGRGQGQTPSPPPSKAASMSTTSGGAAGAQSSTLGGSGAPMRPASTGTGNIGVTPSDSGGANTASPVRSENAEAGSLGADLSASGGVESNTMPTGGKPDSAGVESSAGGNAKSASLVANSGTPPRASGGAPMRPASTRTGSVGVTPSDSGGANTASPVRPENAEAGSFGADLAASGGVESNAMPTGGKPDSAGVESSAGGNAKSASLVANSGTPPRASGGAPMRPSASGNNATGDAPTQSQSASNAGSGASAAIAAPLEQKLDKLTDVLLKQAELASAPKKATLGERMGDLNHHVEKEKATTGVSINTHHAD